MPFSPDSFTLPSFSGFNISEWPTNRFDSRSRGANSQKAGEFYRYIGGICYTVGLKIDSTWSLVVRKILVAGNWKMNLERSSSVGLAQSLSKRHQEFEDVDVAICPPFVYLDAVAAAVSGSSIGLGGQDVYHETGGTFTGETSPQMLNDIGCQYVILGHTERRNVIGESNELINRKVKAALAAGLKPILCVGELLEQREAGKTLAVVTEQFNGSLADISADQMKDIVLAYEPVWAIGTGKTASPEQAQEVHFDLRKIMAERYNSEIAQSVRILYGGSVKPANAGELLSQTDIDGALVGGASLDADSFTQIIAAGCASSAT